TASAWSASVFCRCASAPPAWAAILPPARRSRSRPARRSPFAPPRNSKRPSDLSVGKYGWGRTGTEHPDPSGKLIPTLLAEGHDVMASQHGLDSLATDVAAVKACLAVL